MIVGFAVIVVVEASADPGLTTKVLLVPVSDPEEFVAVIVQVPVLVIIIDFGVSTPLVNAAEVPWPTPISQFEVTTTVPVKLVTVS
tara:strand:+ start:216 stop:473 length:258 start_codon:yes stop_codon:yes gene_type:complete